MKIHGIQSIRLRLRQWIQSFPPAGDAIGSGTGVRRLPAWHLLGTTCFLLVGILATTWPWALHSADAFIVHWDPPFHAWKLEYLARSIAAGDWLPAFGNTNMHYPNSMTLYYEALHWPQAAVAAALLGFMENPVLVYHLVLLVFWAFSGTCMWMLLHELGMRPLAALAGAFFFVINPYRISYCVEFNMQLNFGIPLFLFFLLRFFKDPGIRWACGMAVALWLQASSELYQAMFIVYALPFLCLGMMARRWRLLFCVRRLWIPAAAAGIVFAIPTWLLLRPYAMLQGANLVRRSLREVRQHAVEPFTFLSSVFEASFIPATSFRFRALPDLQVKCGEMSLYPTLAILFMFLAAIVWRGIRSREANGRLVRTFEVARTVLLVCFFALAAAFHLGLENAPLAMFCSWTPVLVMVLSLAILARSAFSQPEEALHAGLFAAALFAYFMTLGPTIIFLNSGIEFPNVLLTACYRWIPGMQGFRVVSRYWVLVLVLMCVCSSWLLNRLMGLGRFRRWPAHALLFLIPVALVAVESIPRPFRYHSVEVDPQSPALAQLDSRTEPHVVAMVPMGLREIDGMHMLEIARNRRLFVYAWGGFFPETSLRYRKCLGHIHDRGEEAAKVLSEIWPPCVVLVDKRAADGVWPGVDLVASFRPWADLVCEDERFALFDLRPDSTPEVKKLRLVRKDFVLSHPRLVFEVGGGQATTVRLTLNREPLGEFALTNGCGRFSLLVDPQMSVPIHPNQFLFTADAPFTLPVFRLEPGESARHGL